MAVRARKKKRFEFVPLPALSKLFLEPLAGADGANTGSKGDAIMGGVQLVAKLGAEATGAAQV